MSACAGAVGVLAAVTLTACGTGEVVCPAIGWSNALIVTVDAQHTDLAEVDAVTLCAEGACLTPHDVPGEEADLPESLAGIEVLPPEDDPAVWIFQMPMTTPERLTAMVVGDAEAILAESDLRLEWERVGGSPECGGPHEATVVVTI